MVPEFTIDAGARSATRRQACLSALLLVLLAGCGSTEPGQTLGDRRRAIQDGSAPGIVLIPAKRQEGGPGSAAVPAPAKAGATVAPAATSTATAASPPSPTTPDRSAAVDSPERKTGGGFFDSLPPPSGRPMNAAKELKAPELGIPIPANRPASGPASTK